MAPPPLLRVRDPPAPPAPHRCSSRAASPRRRPAPTHHRVELSWKVLETKTAEIHFWKVREGRGRCVRMRRGVGVRVVGRFGRGLLGWMVARSHSSAMGCHIAFPKKKKTLPNRIYGSGRTARPASAGQPRTAQQTVGRRADGSTWLAGEQKRPAVTAIELRQVASQPSWPRRSKQASTCCPGAAAGPRESRAAAACCHLGLHFILTLLFIS
jgi:hypothetical protein